MGWWQVDGDTLVRSRFVVCPFTETFAALRLLNTGTGAHPGEDAWLRAHLPAYRARLAADPVTALLVRSGMGTSWIADFLAPLPRDGTPLEDTLARIRATDPAVARADVRVSLRGPLPAALERDDLPERAAALLAHVWTATVRPYWDRRRRILEADVVARTAQVSRGGWAAVIDSLLPGQTRWLGDNRLQVNRHERPPRDIRGAELVFVPVTAGRGWATWEEPRRYALVYGCTGALADPGARSVPESLGTLLGAGRARVLVLLDAPLSTSQLVAVTGQALGSVGRHLRVLLDAGLVERRRAGRSVLYVRTAAGEALVEASGAARGVAGPSAAVGAGAGDSPGGVRLRS